MTDTAVNPNAVLEVLFRPYRWQLEYCGASGRWVAQIVEFPGCCTDGESQMDAMENLNDAAYVWIESCLATGRPIPAPHADPFSVRAKVARRDAHGLLSVEVVRTDCEPPSLTDDPEDVAIDLLVDAEKLLHDQLSRV